MNKRSYVPLPLSNFSCDTCGKPSVETPGERVTSPRNDVVIMLEPVLGPLFIYVIPNMPSAYSGERVEQREAGVTIGT